MLGCPEAPEALFRRGSDGWLFLGHVGEVHYGSGRRWYGGSIPYFRETRFVKYMLNGATVDEDGSLTPREVPDLKAQARADEIIAAHEKWMADREAAREAAGYTAATRKSEEISKRVCSLRADIMACRATTLEGAVAKATVAAWCLPELKEDNLGPDGEGLAMSLVRDLRALAVNLAA